MNTLISTGYPSLDNLLGGIYPGNFVFIGSRPCMGKTSMAVNLAINILDKMNLPVLFFSLEHSSNQLRSYFRSIRTGIPIEHIRKNVCSREENDLINEVERLHHYDQIFIDDTPCISISDIRNKSMFLVREYGVKCIILDFFGLISHVSSINSKEYEEEMCAISHSLKEIAMELGVPVIVFGQIERSADIRYLRDRQVPQLLDLSASSIVSDADVIAFLLNHDYYRHRLAKMDNEQLGNLEVVVAQNNHGSIGDCLLRFDNKTCKIEEL